ncbi:MAG: hypothetical protein AAF436_16895 [Myxococcota bacterium]
MSTISVFGLASGIFVVGFVATIWLSGKMNDAAVEVFTGVIQGFTVPIKNRWIWLYQVYVSFGVGLVTFSFALGLAEFQLSKMLASEGLRAVVYLYAFVFFVVAAAALLMGVVSGFISLAAQLRREQRDGG